MTAANFADAFNRDAGPEDAVAGASFIEDIVGAQAVLDGKATRPPASGAEGQKLEIRLTKVAPDFLARITMPFFPAIPTNCRSSPTASALRSVVGGPYYVQEWAKGRTALLIARTRTGTTPRSRGSRWPAGERRRDPVNVRQLARGDQQLRVEQERDRPRRRPAGCRTPSSPSKYGVNKGRLLRPQEPRVLVPRDEHTTSRCSRTTRSCARRSTARSTGPQMVRQHGFLGGSRTDQILPPGMPGFKDWTIYPLRVRTQHAREGQVARAGQHPRRQGDVSGRFNRRSGPTVAQVVQFNLKQIGLDVDIKLFDRVVQTEKGGTRGEPFDILARTVGARTTPIRTTSSTCCSTARASMPTNNINLSYFNNPKFNRRMTAASKLSGRRPATRRTPRSTATSDEERRRGAGYINTNARILRLGAHGLLHVPAGVTRSVDLDGRLHQVTRIDPNETSGTKTRAGIGRRLVTRGAAGASLSARYGSHAVTAHDLFLIGASQSTVFRYLIRRLLWAFVLFLVRDVVTYVIFFIIPANPAALVARQARDRGLHRSGRSGSWALDQPVYVQYARFLNRLSPVGKMEVAGGRPATTPAGGSRRPSLGTSFATRQEVNDVVAQRRARDGLARVRRRDPVDAGRAADRDPLGAAAALAARPRRDGLRPDRDLRAPGLDRADPRVLLRLQAGPVPDHRLLRLLQPRHRVRRARAVGVAPRAALDDVRVPVRRAVRADDPRERDGDAERGLRAHRAREGRARVARAALARAAQLAARRRDDARDGHRPRARRRDLHRERSSACPGSARSRSRRSTPTTYR